MRELNAQAAQLRTRALALAAEDAAAFAKVGAAYSLPRDTDEEKVVRCAAIQESLVAAAEPPRAIGALATQLVIIAHELVSTGNPNVISDVAVAVGAARAALEAAIVNIEINAAQIQDEEAKAQLKAPVSEFADTIVAAADVTRRVRELITA